MARFLKFFIPSLIGALLFIIPIPHNGSYTVAIGIAAQTFQKQFADYIPATVTAFVVLTALLSLFASRISSIRNSQLLSSTFAVSPTLLGIRVLGAILCVLTLYHVGPEWIHGESTGGLLLYELLPVLFSVFLFASLLLALLVNFGLLEFFGALLSKVMRPLFKLPGRSAIDCLASWMGDGTIGILMTSKQYEAGYYTAREAATIGTTFSVVSITFSIVVISQVNLAHMFIPFYATVTLSGIICAIILPRIPPLSWKEDSRCTKSPDEEMGTNSSSFFKKALNSALKQADTNSLKIFVSEGLKNLLEMWTGVLPMVMAVGTSMLLIAEFTPFFTWLGKPFIPYLELLQIPEAAEASKSIVVGFADMFLPVTLAANIESELTRFVIACVSVTQLIFMTETGGLLLSSKIPVTFWDLCVVFLIRTVISLLVIALVAHNLVF